MVFSQSVHVKRMIEAVALEPKQSFWIMTINLLADAATVEWSKVFGSRDEQTHWTKAVPKEHHEDVRAKLLETLKLDEKTWATYRDSIVSYRNQIVAHHDLNAKVAKTPQFDVGLLAADFMFSRLRELSDPDFLGGIPSDLSRWATSVSKNMTPIVHMAFAASASLGSNVASVEPKAAG